MKKKLSLMLVFILLFMVGCNNADQTQQTESETANSVETEQQSEPEQTKDGQDQEEDSLSDQTAQENSQSESKEVYISGSKLNIRETPSAKAAKVGDILRGKKVSVLEETTDELGKVWYRVEIEKAQQKYAGWIAAEYTVVDRQDLLGENLRGIDFEPQEKNLNYEDNPRQVVKGVYVTRNSAAGAKLEYLLDLVENTEINTFVIDVKDDNGYMLFETEAAAKFNPEANKRALVKDIDELMKKLKEHNVYTIARIVSFKDPSYSNRYTDRAITNRADGSLFQSSDGLKWASPHDRQLWEYNVAVAKEAAQAGFNEIQFDYVRFPASNGGKLDAKLNYKNDQNEGKSETIQKYLKYARKELDGQNVYIGADVFGLVGSVADDMGIGQYWEAISNSSDIICPMMYPSHYGSGVYGMNVPDAKPYETVYQSTFDSIERNDTLDTPAVIRPWIQDFTATWVRGHIRYTQKELKDQIRALNELGVEEYMLWNASNNYSIK